MELEQLFSILKLICANDAIRTGTQLTNEYEVIIYQFRHWCHTKSIHSYDSIVSDIYNPNPNNSYVLQWFRRQHQINIYNHIVDIINQSQKQQLQQNINENHQTHNNMSNSINQTCNFKRPFIKDYQSYSSSNDDDTDDPLITPINTQHKKSVKDVNINFANYYYNEICIDTKDMSSSYNHTFECLTVKYSLFEFILSLQSLNLSTINAVWQKIPKNEDELIGNKQNLCLCIHILICICIQNKYKSNALSNDNNNNEYNKFQTHENYLQFLDDITCNLCQYFLNRNIRRKLNPKCLTLTNNLSQSQIVMGFGDLVESLPKWLLSINTILSQIQ